MLNDEFLIVKIENVLSKFPNVQNSYSKDGFGYFKDKVSHGALNIEVSALADYIYGSNHPIAKQIKNTIDGSTLSHLQLAEGMLRGTINAINNGLLKEIKTQVLLDIQTDFIEAARNALSNTSKDVAAVLLSIVLEDSVKRLAIKNNMGDLINNEFSVVVSSLLSADIISKSTKGILLSYKDLRNSALHAQWHEVSIDAVTSLLYFLPTFIEKHQI